jgi:hypothetical protein
LGVFDLALNQAKDRGKAGCGVFDPTVNVRDRRPPETRQPTWQDQRLDRLSVPAWVALRIASSLRVMA